MKIIIFIPFMILILSIPCKAEDILFFCGSAVKIPMDEIIQSYKKEKGINVTVIYGGSGTLMAQMEISRRGDLYLSGSPDYIETGERKNILTKKSMRKIAYLIPSIIVPRGNPARIYSLQDLCRKGVRIGIGNPQSVCLGLYSIELFCRNGLLSKVFTNIQVFTKSCEDTATIAVFRKVDAVIGWDVFYSWNPSEVEWIKIPGEKIPRISYCAVSIPVYARNRKMSFDLINYIISKKGKAVFNKWNYITEEREAHRYAKNATTGGEYILPDEYFRLLRHEK